MGNRDFLFGLKSEARAIMKSKYKTIPNMRLERQGRHSKSQKSYFLLNGYTQTCGPDVRTWGKNEYCQLHSSYHIID